MQKKIMKPEDLTSVSKFSVYSDQVIQTANLTVWMNKKVKISIYIPYKENSHLVYNCWGKAQISQHNR